MRASVAEGTIFAMAEQQPDNERSTGTVRVKRGLAEMLKGGVIMDVTNAEPRPCIAEAGWRHCGDGARARAC